MGRCATGRLPCVVRHHVHLIRNIRRSTFASNKQIPGTNTLYFSRHLRGRVPTECFFRVGETGNLLYLHALGCSPNPVVIAKPGRRVKEQGQKLMLAFPSGAGCCGWRSCSSRKVSAHVC